MDSLELITIGVAAAGTLVSFLLNVIRRSEFNNKLESILSNKKNEIERILLELYKQEEYILNKKQLEIEKLKWHNEQMKIFLSKKLFEDFQKSFKYNLLDELNTREKELLNENLNQKYLSGRVDYLNKLLQMGNVEKVITTERQEESRSGLSFDNSKH